MTQRYQIWVAYDGSAFAGWQVQPEKRTVQGELERAIRKLTGETVKLHGSGRTDQGVHARGQSAHFDLSRDWGLINLRRGINTYLPPDIRVLNAQQQTPHFHARRSAVSKEYRYFIWNAENLPPDLRHARAHIRRPLNVDAMRKACEALIGRHDFAAFTANPNRFVESTVRHVMALQVRKSGPEIVIIAKSDGFLYKMVRSLVGFLIRVGEGDLAPEEAGAILKSGLRTAVVPTAPPQGLFLWKVNYGRGATYVRNQH
ncbi:MAG: tRNA pseudouridine(38-40) synthase TruA [Lentisphaerae bacterium]|nr:tRNA pseudouridine(38-40) synthase TruA [Lentisphaerota bacterium]